MKLKPDLDTDELAAMIDNEGFWYALSSGGYIDPHEILDSKEDADRVCEAIKIIEEFEWIIPKL